MPRPETAERRPLGSGGAHDSTSLLAIVPDAADSLPDPRVVAELLARLDEREMWVRRLLAAERAAYRRGRADGHAQGYCHAEADWIKALTPARAAARAAARSPSHAELERRRWVVRGEQRTRETFGQPHAADYPGRESA